MRLTADDIINYCKVAEDVSDGQFTITATKNGGFWTLDLLNNRTNTQHRLASFVNWREAHEFLRAFYAGLRFSRLLIS